MSLFNFRNASALIICFSTALIVFLTVLGPSPPVTTETYRPRTSRSPKFILGNASYAAFDETADRLWDDVLPETGGTVLATNLTTGLHFWAQLAMFHQLSCLRDVRAQFYRMTRSVDESYRFMEDKSFGSPYHELGYCFDYLLQGIFCHADTTLHPVATLKSGIRIVDGNALWHMCRDSAALTDWATLSGTPHKDPLVHEQQYLIRRESTS